jgi:hypothetical protein
VYLFTAWSSTAFHNVDERYQSIEFAQWQQGELTRA